MLEKLQHHPFFTTREANELGVSNRMLSHWVKQGKIERIQRGVYEFAEAPTTIESKWMNLYRAAVTVKGVICLLSALDVYGLTDHFVDEYWIAVENERGSLHQPNTRLVRVRDVQFEQTQLKQDGLSLPIFSAERTLVDGFRLLDKETALKALKGYCQGNAGTPDFKRLHRCAKKLRFNLQPYLETMMM